MDSIKIDSFTFHIENGGLLIIITTGNKEDTYRFDPKESLNLSDFLARHQHEFNAAIKSPEAVLPIVTRRAQVEAWLDQAFHSGIPPDLHIILGKGCTFEEWQGLDFSDANLRKSIMSQVNLSRCMFRNTDLSCVDFTVSVLEDCNLEGANLWHAHLDMAFCARARFTRAKLIECRANSVDFRDAAFIGATLRGSSFCNGDFRGADLSGADLTGCNLQNCEFGGANLRRAILKGANTSYSRFDGADLTDADLSGVTTDEDGIFIDRQTLWRPQPPGESESGIRAILIEPPLDDVE